MKTRLILASLFVATLISPSYAEVTTSIAGFDWSRIRSTGANNAANAGLYGSGNDDDFGSYGIVSFLFTAADFGGPVSDLTGLDLRLTFNDRGFSDGSSFEVLFTADDQDDDYTGLMYDNTEANDPNGINAAEFTSLISLGASPTGFDLTDGSLGGTQFDYSLDLAPVEAALIGEINAGSEFSLIIAAVDNADDITFLYVANTFDPGAPVLSISAVPEPSSLLAFGVLGVVAVCRRRRQA